jgi:acetoin utilization protein AcuB
MKGKIMLVKNWMRQPVVTISSNDTMYMARKIMTENNIRSLPVVKGKHLVGLITDRELKRAEASDATSLDVFELNYLLKKVKVEKIMRTRPVTISFDATLSEAAEIMLEQKLDALPVMTEGSKLIGILTQTDVERAILTLTAFGRRGIQFGIRISDMQSLLMELIDTICNTPAQLASLITTDPMEGENMREAYFHVYGVVREKLPGLIIELQQKGDLLYIVDLRNGERRIFEG